MALYSKNLDMVQMATTSLKHLAYIAPEKTFPILMENISQALTTLTGI